MTIVVIIGAGVAGLAAAQCLQQQGIRATLYEKSRGVGGRAATRRIDSFTFDHGAQYVKAPSAPLLELMHASHACDLERDVWAFTADGTIDTGDPVQNADPKWTWQSGVTTLAKTLAAPLDVRLETTIQRIEQTPRGGYRIYDSDGTLRDEADYVLLTPPAPQICELLEASQLDPVQQHQLLALLRPISYRPCLSIALAYAQRPALDWYALINTDRQHPITWLAAEHDKAGHVPDPHALFIAQMSPQFTQHHWDSAVKGTYGRYREPLPDYVTTTHTLVQALVGTDLGQPLWANVQRWKYALPEAGVSFEQINLPDSRLFFAGDFTFGRGRVHLAIESGWHAGERIGAAIRPTFAIRYN